MAIADFLRRCTDNHVVMWLRRSCHCSSDSDNDFIVPYIVVGRLVMECRYGPERHAKQKSKRKASTVIIFSSV